MFIFKDLQYFCLHTMMHILFHYPILVCLFVCFLNEMGCNCMKMCPRDMQHLFPTKYFHFTLKLQQEALVKCHASLLKLCIVWSFSTCRAQWQMWSGRVPSSGLHLTQKIGRRIFMWASLVASRDSLFHDRHTTLPVAHMGKLPHHTVKTLPDGLHILLLADSVVMG